MLEKLKNNSDVVYRKTLANCELYYQEQMCNILEFMKDFYPKLEQNLQESLDELFPGICKTIDDNEDAIVQLVFSGLLVARRKGQFYAFDLAKPPSRTTSDSIAEPDNVLGSRDGFVENFKENIALIRTRVKDDRLCIDSLTLGRRSKTIVSILSIT
ncbi:MAG: spore germination protein, partial [Anaeroplasmataceae bacterium]|nr:spore germination protein [Anaeroplasmataceae bacterium]